MIPVKPQPEPADFDAKVRAPGRSFLASNPHPNRKQFSKNNFWRPCLEDLRVAYDSICAYSGCWLSTDYTLDHFLPKSTYPSLAYEWENYRLLCARINHVKSDRLGILDPFGVQLGWFALDCASFYVHPGSGLAGALADEVRNTIDALQLNHDALVEVRFNVARDYSQGSVTFSFLLRRYPFVGLELQRQGLVKKIRGAIK